MLKTKMNERQKRIIVDTAGISLTLIACVVYLFIGVVWHLWHPYWIVFALIIGLSAVAKIVVEAKIKIDKIAHEEELNRIREQEEREANKIRLLTAPKQVKIAAAKPATKTVKIAEPKTINVEEMIENKKAEIRKRTLGVDIKEPKTSTIKEQSVKLTKPKTTKIEVKKEVKTEPVKKVSATKPENEAATKKANTTKTKAPAKKTTATKSTLKTTKTKTTAAKKASTAKKVIKK